MCHCFADFWTTFILLMISAENIFYYIKHEGDEDSTGISEGLTGSEADSTHRGIMVKPRDQQFEIDTRGSILTIRNCTVEKDG